MKTPTVTSNPYRQQKPPKQAISPGSSLHPTLCHLHQSHFKVVLKEVVGFPKVFLIIPIVEALTDGVILELPPLAVIHSLTLASIIPGIVHTQGFFLSQDIVPKLEKEKKTTSWGNLCKGKENVTCHPLECVVAGRLRTDFAEWV